MPNHAAKTRCNFVPAGRKMRGLGETKPADEEAFECRMDEGLSDDTCQLFQHFVRCRDNSRAGREGPLRHDHARKFVSEIDG